MKYLQSTVEGVWKSLDETEITDNDISLANATYEENKPKLTSEDSCQLIGVDVSIDTDSVISGIINCLVNSEHKQIRF